MSGRERGGRGRLLFFAVIIVAVGAAFWFSLRAAGLAGAADVATLVTAVPLLGALAGWAGVKWKGSQAKDEPPIGPGELLLAVGGLRESVKVHSVMTMGLDEVLGRVEQGITNLVHEREELRGRIAALEEGGRTARAQAQATAEALRAQLDRLQQRLNRAEELRDQFQLRLNESQQQLRLAKRLRDEALAQARQARRMAGLGGEPGTDESSAAGVIDPNAVFMDDIDQQATSQLLDSVDYVLEDQAEKLTRFKEKLEPKAVPRSLPTRLRAMTRRRVFILSGTGSVIAAGAAVALVLWLESDPPRPPTPPPATSPPPTASQLAASSASPSPTHTGPLMARISADGSLADGYTTDLQHVVFSPDSKSVAGFSFADRPISGSGAPAGSGPHANGLIDVWQVATGQAPEHLEYTSAVQANGDRPMGGLAFSPNGESLLAGGDAGTLQLFDLKSRHGTTLQQDPDNRGISAVAYSVDGQTIAEANLAGNIHLLDVNSKKWTRQFRDPAFSFTTSDVVDQIAFSPKVTAKSDVLAISDSNGWVYAWDNPGGHSPIPPLSGVSGTPGAIAFSADGPRLAVAKLGTQLWDVATDQDVGWENGPDNAPETEALGGPGGRVLAIGDADGRIYLWDMAAPGIRFLTSISCTVANWGGLVFSPDGQYLAAYGKNGNKVYLFKVSYSR